jgi:ankyrin repeat protein
VNVKDKKHYTPLHAAAAGGQCHAVKMLLELGANVSHMSCMIMQYSDYDVGQEIHCIGFI